MNLELDRGNGSLVESQKCSRHIGFKGNPFLYDGCEVIEDCARCPYSSSCNYDIIYGGDWSSTKVINFTCGPNLSPTRFGSKLSMGVILGVSSLEILEFKLKMENGIRVGDLVTRPHDLGPDGTKRHLRKWCKNGQSKGFNASTQTSDDLIAIGTDGRGGTIKVLKSQNLSSL
ncbi:hypothetical protein L1987_37299 [Smallanthus sonchifolius]|uniref:Uncharacterized protein n=1 Tax=Smallanthus sonchifolius TaxID=185202 RepID=A0ACB9HHC1_9ASTR|nr:hypothetical protein L1987_37299 [Smallanthus sonchifolius]